MRRQVGDGRGGICGDTEQVKLRLQTPADDYPSLASTFRMKMMTSQQMACLSLLSFHVNTKKDAWLPEVSLVVLLGRLGSKWGKPVEQSKQLNHKSDTDLSSAGNTDSTDRPHSSCAKTCQR